jgi:hypothetical protein
LTAAAVLSLVGSVFFHLLIEKPVVDTARRMVVHK